MSSHVRAKWYGLLLVFAVSGPALAEIVVCTDAEGHKEYAEKCPEGSVSKPVKIYSSPTVVSTPEPSISEQEAGFRRRELEREEKEKEGAAAAKKKALLCAEGKQKLSQLDGGTKLRYDNSSPIERRGKYLDDSDRDRERQYQQKKINENCL